MKNTLPILISFLSILGVKSIIAQVPNYVPTTGLQAWYPFNGNANDATGNGNNGTLAGTTLPTPTTDRNGNSNSAYSFVGVNATTSTSGSHILLPDFNFNGWNEFTVSIWVYETSVFNAGQGYITFGYMKSSGPDHPVIAIQRDNFSNPPSVYSALSDAVLGVPDNFSFRNNWKNYTITYSPSAFKLYIDGVLIGTTFDVLPPIPNGYGAIARHTWNNGSSTCTRFNGKMDDVGIWSRALTQNEISNLYAGTTTSIGEVDPYAEVNLFPNPSSDIINFKTTSFKEFNSYKIYDAAGRVVITGQIREQNTLIDLSHLSSGIYSLVALGRSNHISKIIKD